MKRGHSNVLTDRIEKWDTPKDCAKLPLVGGATVQTCKQFPPLALHKRDWETIGRFMGWLPTNSSAQPKDDECADHDDCPKCGTASKPAEGVPDQSLRGCPNCGETWFEDLNEQPRRGAWNPEE